MRLRVVCVVFSLVASMGVVACRPKALLPIFDPDRSPHPTGPTSAPTITLIPSLMPTATGWARAPTITPTPSWDDHLTILVMGIDARPARLSLGTDVIMVFDINPAAGTAGVLSIPRYVWLFNDDPNEPLRQANRFYGVAELDIPGRGGEAVKEALRRNLGIEVDAYAVIDFQVFVRLIDAIGGVDLELTRPIVDPAFPDMNSGYDPLYIPAGPVHMDGALALRFVRTRHMDSDYGRILRQQLLLKAVMEKLSRPGAWERFVGQVPGLWRDLRGRIDTDLTLDQLIQLIAFARAVPADRIKFGTCGSEAEIERQTLNNSQQVWVLKPEGARTLVREVFNMDATP